MKEIVLRIPEIEYVLVHWPENKYTPWVAAWAYNEEGGYWGQGHYFCEKKDALQYLCEVLEERYPAYMERRIKEIISRLMTLSAGE